MQRDEKYAWLNIPNINSLDLYNPFKNYSSETFIDKPGLLEAALMMDKRYLYFAAKYILGIELLPVQAAILEELWYRPFPMFIASRGASKCITGDSWIESNRGFLQIKDVCNTNHPPQTKNYVSGLKLRGENGFNDVEYTWHNGITPTIKLKTTHGYSLEGTYPHPIRIKRQDDIVWKELKDIRIGDLAVIDINADDILPLEGSISQETKRVCNLLGKLISSTSRIPHHIFSAPKDAISEYLVGVINCPNNSIVGDTLNIPIKSKDVLNSLKFLFTRLGIISLSIEEEDSYALSISGKYITKLILKLDIQDTINYNKLRDIGEKYINEHNGEKYFYDAVTSLEASEAHTFDVHIPNDHSFISNGFVSHNTFLLAVYSMLKLILTPPNRNGTAGAKIVLIGAGFRQSKLIFDYMEGIWHNAPVLQSLCNQNSGPKKETDKWTMNINNNWGISIPLGNGEKIRGLRATTVITDEFGSLNPEIYEKVVEGFGAVTADPITNVKRMALKRLKESKGTWTEKDEEVFSSYKTHNQSIIAGTCTYAFMPFGQYWKRWKGIVESRGDSNKLKEVFSGNSEEITEGFDWRDYSIIRYPIELVPEGFMDMKTVSKTKASAVDPNTYFMEYSAVFCDDSQGFYRRTLIESCVTAESYPVQTPLGDKVWFDATTSGNPKGRFVYGIDTASERDNYCITVLEVFPDHQRIVYVWTIRKKEFKEHLDKGLTKEQNYYAFCARKLRDLMKKFPIQVTDEPAIAIDTQGGGYAAMEALQDLDKMEKGEHALLPVIIPNKSQPTDKMQGLHVIVPINFADSKWLSDANHNMRKDFTDKALLFPRFDSLSLEIANNYDLLVSDHDKGFDSLEDCLIEIEELKRELASIIVTRVGVGVNARDRWETPEVIQGGKKVRVKKDRYCALLMANDIAHKQKRTPEPVNFHEFLKGANKGGRKGGAYDSSNQAGSIFKIIRR
jgi:hypothetical protein